MSCGFRYTCSVQSEYIVLLNTKLPPRFNIAYFVIRSKGHQISPKIEIRIHHGKYVTKFPAIRIEPL